MVKSCFVLVRNSHTRIYNVVTLICISTLYMVFDDSFEYLELDIERGYGIRDSTILEDQVPHS